VGVKIMYRYAMHPEWAEAAGCLIIRNHIKDRIVYDYPVPGPDGDEDAALSAIEECCMEAGVPPIISVVPAEKAPVLLQRYPYVRVSDVRTWRDYFYYTEDLQYFTGRRYAGQRNHIKKFFKACPDAAFRVLTGEDAPAIEQFWTDYEQEFTKADNPSAAAELKSSKHMLRMAGKPWFRCGGMFDGQKLIALALAEKCGETLVIHIEKALYSYQGVYPAMVQAFAQEFGKDVKYLNREDDAADRGLRTSKLQYGPAFLAPKYCFEPQNELLSHVREIPELTTERLTLSALKEEDIPAYNALVLDGERNRWWGYDDVAGLGGPVEQDSFYKVAQTDFQNRTAVNFAVRLSGKLIGEAVLYRFNYRGDAELGCRIAPEYAGNGYGTEAFSAVADWALYKVHLTRVLAKCYHENEASRKMLTSCMRPSGQDDTFFYFTKEV
jgi:RimJ/RimL family protein N-acetyltransferase